MGRNDPSPGPPTTTSQPTTGSARKLLRSTFGLPLTACVLGACVSGADVLVAGVWGGGIFAACILAASTASGTAGLSAGAAARLSCVVGSAASIGLGSRVSALA